ncbi:MAG: thermonuclease family protein [Proteobacteria bacterium]|nr:thermonuclease family protein [Pseudomonadota bacterium]
MKFSGLLILMAGVIVPVGVLGVPETVTGPISARVLRVIDGDTIVVRARIWLGQDIDTQVRLDGVDAPELKGKCVQERLLAEKARDLIRFHVATGVVVLRKIKYGKYAGRVVARVDSTDGEELSQLLIRAGLGRAYDGGRRLPWC